jgi:hypothetical protein
MNRRKALGALAASPLGLAGSSPLFAAGQSGVARQYYELRRYQLRNGSQPERAKQFFEQHLIPASKRTGAGSIGLFNALISDRGPFWLMLITYHSFADAEHFDEKLLADSDFAKAAEQWHQPRDPGFVRYENTLLRAFEGMPQLKTPPPLPHGKHVFEMRTYESNDPLTLRRKIGMFNGGEMQIFQRLGMNPVFFGEALVGDRMPHLTYMLAYDDLAARERVWKAFGADPAWAKLRSQQGLSDADIVSNISNTLLQPSDLSDIR